MEEGNTHRATAAHFRVSIKFVNDMVKLKRETGSLEPKRQGRSGHGKLAGSHDWVRGKIESKPDVTLDELISALRRECGIDGQRSAMWGLVHRLGLSHKKDLRASEQKRPDVAKDRAIWETRLQPFMRDHLERLVFIDETSLKTNMIEAAGWAPEGTRLIDHTPGGHWNTQTFIAALRHDKIDATGIISGPMDKKMFDLYVEGILAPTLRSGDVVILDNLPAHRSTEAASILKDIGAWFLFLPKYSPDLNPIEMAFSKLKALIRKVAARTYDDLWRAVGNVCGLFTQDECYNFFRAAGYDTN